MIKTLSSLKPSVQSIVSVHKSVNQTGIASATQTLVTFDTVVFDINLEFNTSTSRFTPRNKGYYFISTALRCLTAASAHVVYIRKNGTVETDYAAYGSGPYATASCNKIIYMNGTTDYIDVVCYITAGSAVISGAIEHTYLQATRIN